MTIASPQPALPSVATHQGSGLHLVGLKAQIGSRILYRDLHLSVAPGEILTLMGPSGAGKSTLLGFLSGFLSAPMQASGQIWLNGEELSQRPAHKRRLGLLFQDALLFPHLSVGQNLGFAMHRPRKRRDRRERIVAALADIGLAGAYDRDPATLSGGERARVTLWRTLLSEPAALLLDEPFSKLDLGLRDQIRRSTFETIRAQSLPVLLVTHDPGDAEAAQGPILRLADFASVICV